MQISENHMMSPFCACVLQQSVATLAGNRGLSEPASDLALDFFNLFLWSGIGTTPHSRLFKFRFQFQVHLDQFFIREGWRQGAEHLLIGYQQFLQAGVKVKTLEFLKEILLSMEVALSMFFLFLPISSFGRQRTIVPLRGTLLPIVQRIH